MDLFSIPARVQIGRAKTVPINEYVKVYDEILKNVISQIEKLGGGNVQ